MALDVGWATPVARASEWLEDARPTSVLRACGSFVGKAVLVVPQEGPGAWSMLREARAAGAMVTALCAPERAHEAWAAGADAVLDPGRQDPTWYRGAWTLIYDPAGRIGFSRAARSLVEGGVYATGAAPLLDRSRALLARLGGGPRILRLRASD
jgi:hypothetical protein